MKLNERKCHCNTPGHKHELVGQTLIWEEKNIKLLGLEIYSDLHFDKN